MRRIFLPLAAALPLICNSTGLAASRVVRGDLIYDEIPEAAADPADRLEAYLSVREAAALGWSPKGQLLIATRFGDVDQLHVVDRPGGMRRQITFQREPISEGAFCPDPSRNAILYLADTGGNENSQLYYQRLGEPARLLSDGKSLNGAPLWSNTGRQIAYFSTARDGASHDIMLVDPESGSLPHLLVTGDGAAWIPLDWSPDDGRLLVLKYVSVTEGYLYIVDVNTGQKREVDPASGKVGILDARFSRDGQGVYYVSDRDGEWMKLRLINLYTGDKTEISGHAPWDVESLAISRDGHYLAYAVNEAGSSKLNLLDLRTHQELTPPPVPSGIIDSLSFDVEGKRLAFGLTSGAAPRDAYVLDVAANRLEAWTQSEQGGLKPGTFVSPRLTQFPTFDRQDGKSREIPVFVYEPPTPGPHPVLVLLHAGPEAQYRPEFDPWVQYAVNELHYAVVAPNLRGSLGYGKTYVSLDNGVLREDSIKDLGALLVWVGLQKSFDAKHVVAYGQSYGGYLALAAVLNYGDRLRGAVDFGGITDFIAFLGTTSAYRRDLRRAEYGDERDLDARAFLRRISPLTNAERFTRPVLVVHGKNDARVPVAQSDLLVNRLRGRGLTVWYLQATDEGRDFKKRHELAAYYRTFAQFLATLH